jgi:tetratricopeptide (TPR) repeat protein
MSDGTTNQRTLPLIIGGLCVVLAVLVWQVLPRSEQPYAEEIPVALEEAADGDPVQKAIDQVNGPNPMEGILALKALAEAEPPNVDAVIELGRFSIQSGQIDKARERFAQAIDLAPERSEPLIQLGMLELDGDAPAEALIHFERALVVDSAAHNAWFFQAQCHERLGNPGLALASYKRFLPLSPDTVIEAAVQQRIDLLEQHSTNS